MSDLRDGSIGIGPGLRCGGRARPAPGNSNCLKLEPRHNLHLARMESVRQSADLAEVAAAPPESCSVKSCAIEGVERLHPDLEPHVLPNVELLSQSQIDVL